MKVAGGGGSMGFEPSRNAGMRLRAYEFTCVARRLGDDVTSLAHCHRRMYHLIRSDAHACRCLPGICAKGGTYILFRGSFKETYSDSILTLSCFEQPPMGGRVPRASGAGGAPCASEPQPALNSTRGRQDRARLDGGHARHDAAYSGRRR